MSRMGSEDVHYLKTVLGKPLTLALAEITAKQPRDPIHYLGHWLMKYRYNQELSVKQQQEMQELIGERDRLEREKVVGKISNCQRSRRRNFFNLKKKSFGGCRFTFQCVILFIKNWSAYLFTQIRALEKYEGTPIHTNVKRSQRDPKAILVFNLIN